MTVLTLSAEAKLVLDHFSQVVDFITLVGDSTNDTCEETLTALRDQQGRFKIFASNSGLFATDHASLDWRLRESEDALHLTRQLLRSTQWFLSRVKSSWMVSGPDNNAALESTTSDTGGESISTSVESFDTSEVTSAIPSGNDIIPLTDTMGSPLTGVEMTIDRLYRLSWLIRASTTASQNAKAARFSMGVDEYGMDTESIFRDYCSAVVRSRLPDTDPDLVTKIAVAITARRKRFLYRKQHQYKLARDDNDGHLVEEGATLSQVPVSSKSRTTIDTGYGTKVSTGSSKAKPGRRTLPSTTSASAFSHNQFRTHAVLAAPSVVSTALYNPQSSIAGFQPPRPPKVSRAAKEFGCPYCYNVLPSKTARLPYWKQHFLQDLDPFVCLDTDCKDSQLGFNDTTTWIQHMQQMHAVQWSCNVAGHGPKLFDSEAKYSEHMRAVHAKAFPEAQLPMLARRAKVPAVALAVCSFCPFRPAREPDPGKQSHELVEHVAGHLITLAMISLLADDEGSETGSDVAIESSNAEAHNIRDDLGDLPVLTFEKELADLSVDESRTMSQQEGPDILTLEWGFIENTRGYMGHDRDPVLQTFLRNLYLESSRSLSTKGPLLPFSSVPFARNKRFSGREEELGRIEQALLPTPEMGGSDLLPLLSNPKTFVIYGAGGMGKTQLAAEFVHRNVGSFDAILWAHADDTAKLAQDFNKIACKLGVISEDSVDARDFTYTRELVKRWLVEPRKDVNNADSPLSSWLLVFDSVTDSDMLNAFWPYGGPGSILITSRSAFGWSRGLALRPFSADEALEYLLTYTERSDTTQHRLEIAKVSQKLGGLPLALTQMGGMIIKAAMSFADFAQAYNERERLHDLLHTMPPPGVEGIQYEHSVASVFALENIRHGTALLNVCSMFDPDGINERLFTETFGKAVLSGLPTNIAEYQLAKTELLGSSILTTEKGSGKFFVHRLVQDVARMRMNSPQLRETFIACVYLITELWPFESFGWRHGVERWAICEDLSPHVARLREIADQYQLFPDAIDDTGDFAFARLLTDAGWYYHERSSSVNAEWFNDLAHQICSTWLQRELDKHHPGRGLWWENKLNRILNEMTHNRGCMHLELNHPGPALKHLTDFHAAMQKEFSSSPGLETSDMRMGIAWNELGNAYMLNRNWQKGEECFRSSIATMRKLINFRSLDISLPLVNLGLAYWLQARFTEAKEVLLQGLADRDQVIGAEDRQSFFRGRYLHALGNVVGSLGDQDQSLDYHRKALLHYKNTLGNGHHRTADLFTKIGEHYLRLGLHDNALALLGHALQAYNSQTSGDRQDAYMPEKSRAMYFQFRALESMNRADEATEAMEHAAETISRAEEGWPVDDPSTLRAKDIDRLVAFWSK
ncbi:hypothetical protein LTR62_000919 [Meristemomyces frigidus]|uniref:DUF7779 domain-containing protein n=1 Tax=Meristemomyces frigidus TaxID=1508187 RepID=A0AAN7T8W0_9PEZI|nr:hypothetical protein LTR62_000919 [Meristemomyces frigidus]